MRHYRSLGAWHETKAIVFNKGFPWTTPDIYHRSSATYQIGNIRTPTLIHVGGNDERCPPPQSRFLHRVLKEYNKVPTELLVYPGGPHGLTKYKQGQDGMGPDLVR